MLRERKGYTLIEVMLVVILISILAGIVIPRFLVNQKQARVQSCETNRAVINTQIESYFLQENSWPAEDLSDMGTNVNYFPDGIPTCPVDMSNYVLTSSRHRVSGHREGDGTHVWKEQKIGFY